MDSASTMGFFSRSEWQRASSMDSRALTASADGATAMDAFPGAFVPSI